ncbi:MAG TPA: prepilin-type N-terminal cleavage/methylation domain-containing protein [Candidatus Paceibacterota bacterium]|nr:prepilin-type N-terminal cleavage/methylation domain-containing protein [Candidatus Paceibacterota bacterium]
MRSSTRRQGFSLIEVIITVSVMALITVIAVPMLLSANRYSDLRNVTRELVADLSEAQQQAAAGSQGTTWGVRIGNTTTTPPFYSEFVGSSYASGTVKDYHRLPASVSIVSSTLAVGTTTDIIFSLVSGAASNSTTIKLSLTSSPTVSSTITVASSGMIGYVAP